MLAAALLVVLIGLASQVLVPMMSAARKGSEQIHLQQLCQLCLEKLARDFSGAPREGLSQVALPGGATVLTVQKLNDVTPRGQQLWGDSLSIYWLDPVQARLWHRTWPPEPPAGLRPIPADGPYEPTVTELQAMVASPGPDARVLAPNVSLWLVDLAAVPATVRIRLESQGEYFELTRRVVLRNRRF